MDVGIVWSWDSGQHSPAIVFALDLGALDAHILRRWGSREEEIKKR